MIATKNHKYINPLLAIKPKKTISITEKETQEKKVISGEKACEHAVKHLLPFEVGVHRKGAMRKVERIVFYRFLTKASLPQKESLTNSENKMEGEGRKDSK